MKTGERSRPSGGSIRARKGPRTSFKVRKRWAIGLAVLAIAGLGLSFSMLPPLYHLPGTPEIKTGAEKATEDPRQHPKKHIRQMRARELRKRFDQAVAMLHARKYEFAIAALHRVIELSPRLPEAHVNMGFALLGLEKHKAAQDFFQGAVALNPRQANAYYGLAVANEGLESLPEAVGAMRTYLHLSRTDAPHRRKARAALWEWESKIARERMKKGKTASPGVKPRSKTPNRHAAQGGEK